MTQEKNGKPLTVKYIEIVVKQLLQKTPCPNNFQVNFKIQPEVLESVINSTFPCY